MAAGEAAFLLPFVLPRIFRPTLLEVFGLTNLELGTAFSVYGIVAMAAYFLGGPLADRFNARHLLAIALITTAAGGFILLSVPSIQVLILLYAWWGLTTIALFWSPLIRTTREWGDTNKQGMAFGLLDGGRGLLAAISASAMVLLYELTLPATTTAADPDAQAAALRQVILLLIFITTTTAVLAWFALPDKPKPPADSPDGFDIRALPGLFRQPALWLQSIIILCAYVGFKSTDDFTLYAFEVMRLNEIDAAKIGTLSFWIRPAAAITAGFLADRFGANRMTALSFGLLACGSLGLGSGLLHPAWPILFIGIIAGVSLGIYALRGLYFALMKESRIPLAYTGSAVGLVSLVGYTPDVFMGPLMGYLLDRSPGAQGHFDVFRLIAGFAILGFMATLVFARTTRAAHDREDHST